MTKYNPLLSPLDYASKLAERYKRQDAQLERYHQQLRQRDQQEYDAKTAVTPVKVLTQLADTVNKVSSTAIKFDELKAKKVKQNLTSYGFTAQDFLDLRSGEKDLDDDNAALKSRLGALRKRNPKAADYIESLHGRKLFHAKKFFAAKRSLELPSMWSDQVSNDPELKKEFLAIGKDDIDAQKAFMRDWASQQFGDELLDGKLLFQTAGDNLNKWLDSKELKTREAITKIVSSQEEMDWENTSNVYANTNDTYGYQQFLFGSLKTFKGEVIGAAENGGIKKAGNGIEINGKVIEGIEYKTEFKDEKEKQTYYNSIAKELLTQKLVRKGQSGYFSTTERNLVNQPSEVFAEYGGGDKLENVFTKDQWDRIVTASDEGTALAARIAIEQNELQSQSIYNAAVAKYTNPENRGGTNEKNLQQNIDYLYSKGQDDLAKKLEVIQKSDQSALSYNNQRLEWEPEIEKGLMNTKLTDLEKITSVKLRTELIQLKKDTEAAMASLGGKEKFESITDNDIKGLIQGDGKVLLNPMSGTLKGNAQYIYDDFDNFAKEAFAEGVKLGLKGEGLKQHIKQRLKTEWEAGGGHLPPSKQNKGRYARHPGKHNPFANYTAWADQRGIDSGLAQRGLNTRTKAEFDNDLQRSYTLVDDWGDPKFLNKLLSEPESIVSKEDIRGMIENGYYSAELKYKARKLGIPYGTLFEAQVKAIQNDPELAEYAATMNIDDIQFIDMEAKVYESINDSDSLAMLKQRGIENLSLPQLQRLSLAAEGPTRAVDALGDTFEAGDVDPNIETTTTEDFETVKKEKLEAEELRRKIAIQEGLIETEEERRGSLQN